MIDKHSPKPCPNSNRNTMCGNGKRTTKAYRLLPPPRRKWKVYRRISNGVGFIDRRNPREVGHPNCELILGNRTVQYGPMRKEWKVPICNYERDKYNWKQGLRRASWKRSTSAAYHNALHRPRGMLIEKSQGVTLRMQTDYGRIRIHIDIDWVIEAR